STRGRPRASAQPRRDAGRTAPALGGNSSRQGKGLGGSPTAQARKNLTCPAALLVGRLLVPFESARPFERVSLDVGLVVLRRLVALGPVKTARPDKPVNLHLRLLVAHRLHALSPATPER